MATLDSRRLIARLLILFLALLLAAVVVTNTAVAQSGEPQTVTDDEVNDIAQGIFCPVCENTPLDVCPTQACADWREIIRTKLSQGETEQEIKDYFLEQYGPRTLAEPPQEGFALVVWVIPIVAVVVGGFFFSRYVRGIQTADSTPTKVVQPETPSPSSKEPAQNDYITRIESELKERAK